MDSVIYNTSLRANENRVDYSHQIPFSDGRYGSIAQLGEHLPYKQRVTGSSPVVPTISGPVVPSVAQSVEQGTENPRVIGSIPIGGTNPRIHCRVSANICGISSSGRAPPCQGGGSEFEPRIPLHAWHHRQEVRQRSAKSLSPVRFWVVPPRSCQPIH